MLSQALPMTNECWDIQNYKYFSSWPRLAQHNEQPETNTSCSLFLREMFVAMI